MPDSISAKNFALGVFLLAAGASSRMGKPKMLLPWGTTSIIGHLIAQWQHLGANQIAVVCATGDTPIVDELDRLNFSTKNRILNPTPERGMFSSIQCAAKWSGWQSGLTHWAVVLGDQPHLSQKTLRQLLNFAVAHPHQICLPFHAGHRRHPVLLPATSFRRLPHSKASDLKQFFATGELALCEMDDPGLELDIDRPEDYARAVKLFGREF